MKIADQVVKACPSCQSEKTVFQGLSWLESLLSFGSRLQRYRCLDCGHSFKAADRRRFPRTPRPA